MQNRCNISQTWNRINLSNHKDVSNKLNAIYRHEYNCTADDTAKESVAANFENDHGMEVVSDVYEEIITSPDDMVVIEIDAIINPKSLLQHHLLLCLIHIHR